MVCRHRLVSYGVAARKLGHLLWQAAGKTREHLFAPVPRTDFASSAGGSSGFIAGFCAPDRIGLAELTEDRGCKRRKAGR